MKKQYNILLLLLLFIILIGIAYATITTASLRKSSKLPWQGITNGYYDSAHNVGTTYEAEVRFVCSSGTCAISGGSGIVYDQVTGLYWQSDGRDAGLLSIVEAGTYCENLNLGGYINWRVPNVKELLSIVDKSTNNPSIDVNYFYVPSNPYVTTTLYPSEPLYFLAVNFYRGKLEQRSGSNEVMCVR